MPIVRIGEPTIYRGKALFKILANLRDFGRGRIIYRTSDYHHYPDKIHFMRILHAQPLMDADTLEGNVVVERVFQSLRHKEPVVISGIVHKPDFRLVAKDGEEDFCRWDKVRDYDPAVDAEKRPRYMEMPPLLRKVMQRNTKAKKAKGTQAPLSEEELRLPAYKTYRGDHIAEERTEPNVMHQFLTPRYANYQDFDMSLIPENWKLDRPTLEVGRQRWPGRHGHRGTYGLDLVVQAAASTMVNGSFINHYSRLIIFLLNFLGYEEGLGWEDYVTLNEAEDEYKAQLAAERNKSGAAD